jgi:hypothetical protein
MTRVTVDADGSARSNARRVKCIRRRVSLRIFECRKLIEPNQVMVWAAQPVRLFG